MQMPQKIRFPQLAASFLLVGLLPWQSVCAVMPDNLKKDAGRHSNMPKGIGFTTSVSDVILSSTPLEQGDRYVENPTQTTVSFDVDKTGQLSNWRLNGLSGSLARDFWTVYACMTCPPQRPPDSIETPLKMSVKNERTPCVSNKEQEDWRVEQGYGIPRKSTASRIYFSLIPASAIASFPNTVTIGDITDRRNLVGIPITALSPSGKYWDTESASSIINGDGQVAKFLHEWPHFFAKTPHPTREDIISFADKLKQQYNSLLKEGEPEAPLP